MIAAAREVRWAAMMLRYLRMLGRALMLISGLEMATAIAQELNISHQFHSQDDSRGRAAQIFAMEVVRRSPELKIVIHPQLSMGFTRDEQLEDLQAGALDFTVLPFFVRSKKIPEFSVALLPGLVPDLAAARALKASVVHAKLQDIAADNGLHIITWWWMPGGFALAGTRGVYPISLSGLKFQSCGLMQNLLVAAGAQL